MRWENSRENCVVKFYSLWIWEINMLFYAKTRSNVSQFMSIQSGPWNRTSDVTSMWNLVLKYHLQGCLNFLAIFKWKFPLEKLIFHFPIKIPVSFIFYISVIPHFQTFLFLNIQPLGSHRTFSEFPYVNFMLQLCNLLHFFFVQQKYYYFV